MENNVREIFKDLADDYIPLNFKGMHYESVIPFVEILLEKLKLKQAESDIPTIRDIHGREILK